MKAHSIVYVDAIAGKTFLAPKEHPVIDKKGLTFAPHIVVVPQNYSKFCSTVAPHRLGSELRASIFGEELMNRKAVAGSLLRTSCGAILLCALFAGVLTPLRNPHANPRPVPAPQAATSTNPCPRFQPAVP